MVQATQSHIADAKTVVHRLQKIHSLPKPLYDYIWSGQVERSFQNVVSKEQIPDGKLRTTTSRLVGQVLIGELHPNSFIRALTEQGGIPVERARAIARTVSAQVFSPVRNELMSIYKISGDQKNGAEKAQPRVPAIPKQKPQGKELGPPKTVQAPQKPPPPRSTTILPPKPGPEGKELGPPKTIQTQTPPPPPPTPPPTPTPPPPPAQPVHMVEKPEEAAKQPPKPVYVVDKPEEAVEDEPQQLSGPVVQHDVQKGSIAETAARLQRAGLPKEQPKHQVGAMPQVPKKPTAPPKPQTITPQQAFKARPEFAGEQEKKPQGPVLDPKELLAAEEVVGEAKPKKGLLRFFTRKKDRPAAPPPPSFSGEPQKPQGELQTGPASFDPNKPSSPLNSNTVNLRSPGEK